MLEIKKILCKGDIFPKKKGGELCKFGTTWGEQKRKQWGWRRRKNNLVGDKRKITWLVREKKSEKNAHQPWRRRKRKSQRSDYKSIRTQLGKHYSSHSFSYISSFVCQSSISYTSTPTHKLSLHIYVFLQFLPLRGIRRILTHSSPPTLTYTLMWLTTIPPISSFAWISSNSHPPPNKNPTNTHPYT